MNSTTELQALLRDKNNHAFQIRRITRGGFDLILNRSKAQLLRSSFEPDVTEIILRHLSNCACKPMPRWKKH